MGESIQDFHNSNFRPPLPLTKSSVEHREHDPPHLAVHVSCYAEPLVKLFMDSKSEEGSQQTLQRISIRWKVLQALGAVLIALGLFIDWAPPQEANLPDTSSFLIILGGLLGAAGLLAAFRHE